MSFTRAKRACRSLLLRTFVKTFPIMEDDCVCEYDSTWDTESDGEDPAAESLPRRSSQDKNKSSWTLVTWHPTPRNMRAAKDMQNYRRGYPNLTDDECPEDKMNNLQFYLNKSPSAPDDVYIDSFLKEWKNDYKRLERVHSYIQWLFPLREPGVNYMASELTKKEIEAFKKSEDAKKRLVESYELMLGFYGMRLVDKDTGEVRRAENWKERFGNLERNMHNNLRITRILKSLGELGFEHYQAPLVRFFLEETLVKKTLSSVKRSVLDYFLFAVLDKQKRQELVRYAYFHFEPKDKFVWCPRKIQRQFRKAEKRLDVVGNGEGKDEVQSRAKAKYTDTKEEAVDNSAKSLKGDKTSNDKIKSETSPEPKDDVVENGNACSENNNNVVSNGSDCTDDEGMEHSPRADDPDPKTDASSDQKESAQEADSAMQTDAGGESKKPPKKKREDDAEPDSNRGSPQKDGKNGCNKSSGQQTPLKTSKAPLLSGREEKIPRTELNPATDEVAEMSQEATPSANGSAESGGDKTAEERVNGKESEPMDTESSPSNGDNASTDLIVSKEAVNGTNKS
ncbi:opioid growth factor receptor [Eucyclogobius newberryi]|uniref:opioid growth factor receptor n=1 Tax=Eucyclogobius newberryi TaxID=166745 RepID=UPI003B5B8137